MFRHGAEGTGYKTIVGAGSNAVVLHVALGSRTVRPDDLAAAIRLRAKA